MRKLLVGLALAAMLAAPFGLPSDASAGGKKIEVMLLIPLRGAPIASPLKVVITGPPAGDTTLTGGCGGVAGHFPVQSVVVVDPQGRPGAGAHGRFTQVVVLFPVPFRPGTRLGQVFNSGTCTDGGITYQMVSGFVE